MTFDPFMRVDNLFNTDTLIETRTLGAFLHLAAGDRSDTGGTVSIEVSEGFLTSIPERGRIQLTRNFERRTITVSFIPEPDIIEAEAFDVTEQKELE